MPPVSTNIYVDGFNLYYGCLKRSPFRWLDIRALCQRILPGHLHAVHRIRYFTAIVHSRTGNPDKHVRQLAYIRALEAAGVHVHHGKFRVNTKKLPLADPQPGGPTHCEVRYSQEKGSDVNLATYLLIDAFHGDYEAAVVISNDTDLKEPIHFVNKELKKKVGLIMPGQALATDLKKVTKFQYRIENAHLHDSQFPERMTDANGTIHRPQRWK